MPSYQHSFHHTPVLSETMTDFSVEKKHLRNFKRYKADYDDRLDVVNQKYEVKLNKNLPVGLEGKDETMGKLEDLKRSVFTRLQ